MPAGRVGLASSVTQGVYVCMAKQSGMLPRLARTFFCNIP
jgi:hypothetical protein